MTNYSSLQSQTSPNDRSLPHQVWRNSKRSVLINHHKITTVEVLLISKFAHSHIGPRLQEIAMRMAEAVVKFEMLSANPKATVQTVLICNPCA